MRRLSRASYTHAKREDAGSCRIEDIDPPREVAGAADDILRTLEAFELAWDGPVVYQSARREIYDAASQRLLADGRAFLCSCTRSELRGENESVTPYPGTCRGKTRHGRATAVRECASTANATVRGWPPGKDRDIARRDVGDYVIWRRDGLPAYHLAVVLDDQPRR